MNVVTTACTCVAIATLGGIAVAQMTNGAHSIHLPPGPVLLRTMSVFLPGPGVAPSPPSPTAALVPTVATGNTVALSPDRYGQFHAEMEVEGRRVPVLVDTGASWVSLSDTTAADLGFFPAPSDYTIAMNTANGVARAAPVEIAELRVGPIVARRVKAMVMQRGALTTPALLGMSFLRGLSGFSVRDGRLVLEQ